MGRANSHGVHFSISIRSPILSGHANLIRDDIPRTFPYVPTHLHYIMLELLKNSMRATVEYHGVDADYPPIKVVIADGSDNEDVIVKVSDEGGGIPRSNMKRIWSYVSFFSEK